MTRVNVDRMRRYRQRTRPATRRIEFAVNMRADELRFIYDPMQAEAHRYPIPTWHYGEPVDLEAETAMSRERIEKALREMGARTIEWTGKYTGIVSS